MQQELTFPDSIPVPGAESTAPSEQVPASEGWSALQNAFAAPEPSSLLALAAFMVVGGGLAVYIRFLYARTSRPLSSDSIARVFPLLTLVTIAVIAVVKSSLALSLGLVGALSIVRFRAAIKDPEELVYLFLCIGVGLALGAEQLWLSIMLVVAATVFALGFDRGRGKSACGDGFLTIAGPSGRYFDGGESDALHVVTGTWSKLTVHRCDVENGEGELRVQLHRLPDRDGPSLVAKLRDALPECRVSYVNAEALA